MTDTETFGTQEFVAFKEQVFTQLAAIEARLGEMPTKGDVNEAVSAAMTEEREARAQAIEAAIGNERRSRDAQVSELRDDFKTLTTELRAMLGASLTTFDGIAQRVEKSIERLSAEVAQNRGELTALGERQKSSAAQAEERNQTLNARIGATETRSATLFTDLHEMGTRLYGDPSKPDAPSLYRMIGDLSSQIKKDTAASVGALVQQVEGLREQVKQVETFIMARRKLERRVFAWFGKMARDRWVHVIIYTGAAAAVTGVLKMLSGG